MAFLDRLAARTDLSEAEEFLSSETVASLSSKDLTSACERRGLEISKNQGRMKKGLTNVEASRARAIILSDGPKLGDLTCANLKSIFKAKTEDDRVITVAEQARQAQRAQQQRILRFQPAHHRSAHASNRAASSS